MKKISYFICLLSLQLSAQNIPIDSWRSHYSYTNGRILEVANETIFCASENGLFSLNTEDFAIEKFGKENGLGDARITALHFASSLEVLIVGYESGIIDLIYSDGNITTIKTVRDAPIVAGKAIKSITSNGNQAYLATGFGVVYLDLSNQRIVESYRSIGEGGTQLSIDEVLVNGDSLYIISNQGIQAGSFNDNLLDFNDWVVFAETNSLSLQHLIAYEGKLYVIANSNELWSFSGMAWNATGLVFEGEVRSLYTEDLFFALTDTKVFSVDVDIEVVDDEQLFQNGNDILHLNGNIYIADAEQGLLVKENGLVQKNPNGPILDFSTRMRWLNGSLYLFFGPAPASYDGSFDNLGYSIFNIGEWQNEKFNDFSNLTDVASIGENLYFSSMGNGLLAFDDLTIIDDSNSELTVSDGIGTVDISSLSEYNGSLWLIAYNTNKSVIRYDGNEFVNYDQITSSTKYPVDLNISNEGVLWIQKGSFEGGGLSAFNPNTSEQRSFGTSEGLPSSQTTGLVIDSEDRAWISTVNGLATYAGASFPFNSFNISVPVFENGFLFEDEQINDVLTDGGDRIWVATLNGVWVLKDDLSAVVARYTTENSPLPSNEIKSFAYDEITGEVFISTSKGLVSYRSASSKGQPIHSSSISVFPNPVSSGFNGHVGITGLVKNAILKITDVKGRLVKEILASGSSASWDLSTHLGSRVETGIYLIFSSSEDGQQTLVGKIAVLK